MTHPLTIQKINNGYLLLVENLNGSTTTTHYPDEGKLLDALALILTPPGQDT